MTMQNNPWLGFLEEGPGQRASYFSRQDQWGPSQRQQNYYSNSFNRIYDQYLGSLGKQVRAGLMPTGTWDQFQNQFDFGRSYREQVPYEQRTQGQNAFAPSTQWRNPYWSQGR